MVGENASHPPRHGHGSGGGRGFFGELKHVLRRLRRKTLFSAQEERERRGRKVVEWRTEPLLRARSEFG